MSPQPRIETLTTRKLVGKKTRMSFVNNTTAELWRSFKPLLKRIPNRKSVAFYSLEVYPFDFFVHFNPTTEFEKWAAVEVTDFQEVPDELETLTLPSGLYAVFVYKGTASAAAVFYEYIFTTWLTDLAFKLDNRPHFALMGEKYKQDDPNSEEEIWIPVISKKETKQLHKFV